MSRILIVDDEQTILRVLVAVCKRNGHSVLTCSDVEEAITLVQRFPRLDLVITDIVLPGRSGLEFLDWLMVRQCGVRVVVMTAYPNHDFVKYALSHGASDILVKPFNDLHNLHQQIQMWTQKKSMDCPHPV